MGHCPSFKNKKRTITLPNGGTMPVTEKKTKLWMKRCEESFVYQLLSATQIKSHGTPTETLPLSSIVSSVPQDDSRFWISELRIIPVEVAPGEEGALITIEPAE